MVDRDDVSGRIDELEAEVRRLFGELTELRARVAGEAAEAVPKAIATPAPAPAGPTDQTPPATPPKAALATTGAIRAARVLLSEGEPGRALDMLEGAIAQARERRDRAGLDTLASELEGIARYRAPVRGRALRLAALARGTAPSAPMPSAPMPPAVHAPVAHVAEARAPQRAASTPPPAPHRSLGRLARDWDLLGPRGFAIVGGAVTGLGIVLLFVLAANRGWITPGMRVVIGFAASALAVGAGLWVRSRYGQMQASLGSVGAGIAGAYASLAAAAARYDVVPDWLALPLAAVIAAIAVAIALSWRSQVVAAIGLAGSALAPALQAIDTGLSWTSAAFAVIVLAATVAVTVPRRWHPLLVSIGVVVTAQVLWLVGGEAGEATSGTVAVAAALVLVVLAAAVALQIVSAATDLDPLATSFAFAALGLALVLAPWLYEADRDAGLVLAAAAAVWAGCWLALRTGQPSLALLVGVSSLALAGVATADLLSGTSLAVTWAAESALFSALALRLRDARLQVMALSYAGLAALHAWTVDVPPATIFEEPVSGRAAVSAGAVAVALLAAGLLAPAATQPRTETGLLSWLAAVRSELAAHRRGLREGLVFAGVAAGTYAVGLALVSVSFEHGHLAATIVAAAVGAVVTAVSGRRGSAPLVLASLGWLAAVLAGAAAFDVPEFANAAGDRSFGGWALLAAAAGVLAGTFAYQLLLPVAEWQRGRLNPASWELLDPYDIPLVGMIGGVATLASSAIGIGLLSPAGDVLQSTWIGWRLLLPAGVFAVLAAAVFRVPRHRDLATAMWALGLAALVASEWLVIRDATWRTMALAATSAAVALLARPLREARLWIAGWALALATGAWTILRLAELWATDGPEPVRYAIAPIAVTASLVVVAALAWGRPGRRDHVTAAWATAVVSLIFGEAFLLGGGPVLAFASALTGGAVAMLALPLREERLWWGGAVVVAVTSLAVLGLVTPPTRFVTASASPGEGLWVALACLAGGVALHLSGPAYRKWVDLVASVGALYVLSLGVLELAERAFGGSVQTDFERGHVGVSVVWALIGLALLVAGLIEDERLLRYGGLGLFGLSLAKIFLYDLGALNAAARALSFIAVGALVLAGGFFLQRLSSQMGPRRPHGP